MVTIYDGITYTDYYYDSTQIPFREFLASVNMICTPDNKVVIMNGDKTWCFDTHNHCFSYDDDTTFGIPLSDIHYIELSPQGNYYIYTNDDEFWCYNSSSQTLSSIELPSKVSGDVILKSSENDIYLLTKTGILYRYNTLLRSFTHSADKLTTISPSEVSRMGIEVDTQRGNIYVMLDDCISKINASSFEVTHQLFAQFSSKRIFTAIALKNSELLWVGCNYGGGLTAINTQDMTFESMNIEVIDNTNGFSSNNSTSSIYIDPRGGVWITTTTEGVFYHHENIFRLATVLSKERIEELKSLLVDKDGTIIVGTPDGLYRYNPFTGELTVPFEELKNEDCIALYRDSADRIWVGTFRNGLFCVDGKDIRHYFDPEMPSIEESYQLSTPNQNSVRSILEDSQGAFWISIYGGLAHFDTRSGDVSILSEEYSQISHFMFVYDIIQVGDKIFACGNDGYFNYDIKDFSLEVSPYRANLYGRCNQAIEDDHGRIWVATSRGVVVIEGGVEMHILTTNDGLLSNNIIAITQDHLSNIWAISPSSLSCIATSEELGDSKPFKISTTSFSSRDGLNTGITYPRSAARDTRGKIYVGGSQGLTMVDPLKLYQEESGIKTILTKLHINSTPIDIGEEYNNRVILEHSLSTTERITLNHNESVISLEFSNLNYINESYTIYRYKLDNFDEDWIQINSKEPRKATYSLTNAGEYTFRVMATNNGSDWGEESTPLTIVVKPPFYFSWSAYVIYTIFTLLIILYVINRINAHRIARQKQREQREQEQFNETKFRFFTNISHELRTPISLILLPLNKIISNTDKSSDTYSSLLTIERNASNLLSLVNHLLDFRKLEMGGEKLSLSKNNPSQLIEDVVADFNDITIHKDIEIKIINLFDGSSFYFDIVQMNKVFNNLISNAIKFTPKGGIITITIMGEQDEVLIVEVNDTGVGIPLADQSLIFDRFYQVKSDTTAAIGSGIGLHLVKQYVELHKGTISLHSQEGVGSTFCVKLPLLATPSQELVDENEKEELPEINNSSIERVKILIVEDSSELREYLRVEFDALGYLVHTAEDGVEGVKKAREILPSLIVSDIMMPLCDGFELCNTLKNDINTSHIPIILLTARSADDIRYEGYKSGADAFLSKPFSFEVLEIRIQKLLEEHKRRVEKISSDEQIISSQITISELDKKFMTRLIELIESNMSNVEYSVEQLSGDVAMHRMNLYRKIQSIAGMTPSEFIRTMRLKRAAQLLSENSGASIVEISEAVGFNTPKYFTTHFKRAYGVTPSQWAATHKKE